MAAPGKAQMLNEVHTILQKRYKLEPRTERLSLLEAVVYGICHEGATREQATQALGRFRDQFFDWNEVRVSSIEEIRGALAGQKNSEERATALRRFLRQLFEKEYKFEIEGLAKKPLRESIKALEPYDAMGSDYVLATVIQQALGGHAIPVDAPIRRALLRLGVIEEDMGDEAVRSLLERAVPKNRGTEFVDLMEELTHDTCVEGPPDCPRCDLRKICPTGQARLAADKAAARTSAKAGVKAPKTETLPDPVARDPEPSKKALRAEAASPEAKPTKAPKGKSTGSK